MADLREYRIFEGIESREEAKTLIQIFEDSLDKCRSGKCSQCKYKHGERQYTLMACLLERYVENIIAADVAPVRHGRWKKGSGYVCVDYQFFCSFCGEEFWESGYWPKRAKYCPNCGAKMDLKEGAE